MVCQTSQLWSYECVVKASVVAHVRSPPPHPSAMQSSLHCVELSMHVSMQGLSLCATHHAPLRKASLCTNLAKCSVPSRKLARWDGQLLRLMRETWCHARSHYDFGGAPDAMGSCEHNQIKTLRGPTPLGLGCSQGFASSLRAQTQVSIRGNLTQRCLATRSDSTQRATPQHIHIRKRESL